jgi:hypothetical protein
MEPFWSIHTELEQADTAIFPVPDKQIGPCFMVIETNYDYTIISTSGMEVKVC